MMMMMMIRMTVMIIDTYTDLMAQRTTTITSTTPYSSPYIRTNREQNLNT